jgi:hypothetical protein
VNQMVKRKRTSFGSTLKEELYTDLQELSKETDIPMTKLLDRAVDLLLNEMNFRKDSKLLNKDGKQN